MRIECERGGRRTKRWAGLFLTLFLLPCVGNGQEGKSPTKTAAKAESSSSDNERPPFDLTYVPSYATGVFAIRPHAIFQDPAMKPLARMVNDNPMMQMMLFPYVPSTALPIQEIEQIIFYSNALPSGKETATTMGTAMIRTAHDFDWLKAMRRLDPKTKEMHSEDGVYYRSRVTNSLLKEYFKDAENFGGMEVFYFLPDKRTLAVLPIDLRAAQKGKFKLKIGSPSPFLREKNWKHVESELVAWATLNRADKKQIGEDPFPEWTALTKKTTTTVVGLDWNEGIAFQAYLAYKNPAGADQGKKDLKSLLKEFRHGFEEPIPDLSEQERQMAAFQEELMKGLIDRVRIAATESIVCIHSEVKMNSTEFAKGLMSQFMWDKIAEGAVPADKK